MSNIKAFLYLTWRVLRGISSRINWLKSHIISFLLFFASSYITILFVTIPSKDYLSYFSDVNNISTILGIISIGLFVASFIKLFVAANTTITFDKLPFLKKEDILLDGSNLKINNFGEQAILYDPDINSILEFGNNPISYNPKSFQIHPLIKEMLVVFIAKMPETSIDTFDDDKVRLHSDITKSFIYSRDKIYLQKTSYYKDRLSNTLANYTVRLDGRTILDLRKENYDSNNRTLSGLRESKLSNQLGGSVILVTIDSTIVMLRQGNRTDENSGRLSPAGSGSFDLLKPPSKFNTVSFQDYSRDQVKRELKEECGLKISDIKNIQICGFGRYLYRNGKPEVFCIAFTDKTSSSIEIPVSEWDYQQKEKVCHSFDGEFNKENLISALRILRNKICHKDNGYENACGPLYWNIVFAIEYLENNKNVEFDKTIFE